MLVGEIGIPRREFLYEIDFWEVDYINRGYRKRLRLTNQLLAECTFASIFTMRDPKGKTVQDLFPHIFDDEDEDDAQDHLTEEDRKELQQLIDNYNSKGGKE